MKFKVGDIVIITSGRDKGMKGPITRVLPQQDKVVVQDANKYVKHVKPMNGRAGEKALIERPVSTAKIAIINDKDQVDRIGYSVDKAGNKTRIYKKTKALIPEQKVEKK